MTLVGWWPLHDKTAQDYSGKNRHGTLNGNPTTGVAGKAGLQAMSFDGADDYIDIPSEIASGEYTISLWCRVRDFDSDHAQISFGDDNYGITTRTETDGDQYFYHNDGSFQGISASVSTNEWYLLTAVYDGAEIRLYIDGVQQNSLSVSGTGSESGGNKIGAASGGGRRFNGSIFDVRFYNRALSDAEIQTLYQMGSADLANPPTDGVARYALDGDVTDAWENNDGTNNGVTYTNDAIRGQSASFDGSSYIQTPISDSFSTFSWSYWVKPDNSGVNQESYISTRGSASGAGSRQRNGNLDFYAYNSSGNYTTVDSGVAVTAGEWYHVVGVVSSSEIRVYVNGKLESTKSFGTYGNSLEVRLGAKPGGSEYAQANIDDVRIYDYALKPHEVFKLYQWGTRGKDMRKHLTNRRSK